MKDVTIIIEISPEAGRLLAENNVDIVAALREQKLDIRRTNPPPGVPVSHGGKEPMLTILAVGVAANLVAAGIAKILDAVARNRKVLVTESSLVPSVDASGAPVLNAGKPVFYWSEKSRLIEATQVTQDKTKTDLEASAGPVRLQFTLGSDK